MINIHFRIYIFNAIPVRTVLFPESNTHVFHNGSQILLPGQGSADQVADGHTDGHSAMSVAEIPVVVCLEQGTHGVIPDGEGINDGISGLDGFSKEGVEIVLVDAFAGNGTLEATQAATVEGVLPQVDDSGFSGEFCLETSDH